MKRGKKNRKEANAILNTQRPSPDISLCRSIKQTTLFGQLGSQWEVTQPNRFSGAITGVQPNAIVYQPMGHSNGTNLPRLFLGT